MKWEGTVNLGKSPKSLIPTLTRLAVAGRRAVTHRVSGTGVGRPACSIRFWAESRRWEVCY